MRASVKLYQLETPHKSTGMNEAGVVVVMYKRSQGLKYQTHWKNYKLKIHSGRRLKQRPCKVAQWWAAQSVKARVGNWTMSLMPQSFMAARVLAWEQQSATMWEKASYNLKTGERHVLNFLCLMSHDDHRWGNAPWKYWWTWPAEFTALTSMSTTLQLQQTPATRMSELQCVGLEWPVTIQEERCSRKCNFSCGFSNSRTSL